jgi:hypothetical protein
MAGSDYIPVTEWRAVPVSVESLLTRAMTLRNYHEKAATASGLLALTLATWQPDTDELCLYSRAPVPEKCAAAYTAAFETDRSLVFAPAETQPDWTNEVLLKRGSSLPLVTPLWNAGNKLLMGPSPLSRGIVSGLMAGGLGYGAGALAEQLFPQKYVERGKLRRTLATIGALGGLGVAGVGGYANARARRTGFFKGLLTNNKTPVVYPYEQQKLDALAEKQSFFPQAQPPLFTPTISVPQFNNAAWTDVQRGLQNGFQQHTPPQYAAATTGFMTGLASAQRSPIISPATVISGLASAGVGLATANVAGRALSALAGLTPAGQQKLQDLGMWGGMMHAIVPAMFPNR